MADPDQSPYYKAWGKELAQLLDDYERGDIVIREKGNMMEYLHAAIMVSTARSQQKWAKVAALAACVSVVIAGVALGVALSR
jgi:VanZ family protein